MSFAAEKCKECSSPLHTTLKCWIVIEEEEDAKLAKLSLDRCESNTSSKSAKSAKGDALIKKWFMSKFRPNSIYNKGNRFTS